jgi:hypothetical protein
MADASQHPPAAKPETGSTVTIIVNGTSYEIHRGHQTIAAIKQVAGVPPAYQMDQDVGGVLTPLDQGGAVTLKGGEIFVAYPATGSSS